MHPAEESRIRFLITPIKNESPDATMPPVETVKNISPRELSPKPFTQLLEAIKSPQEWNDMKAEQLSKPNEWIMIPPAGIAPWRSKVPFMGAEDTYLIEDRDTREMRTHIKANTGVTGITVYRKVLETARAELEHEWKFYPEKSVGRQDFQTTIRRRSGGVITITSDIARSLVMVEVLASVEAHVSQ